MDRPLIWCHLAVGLKKKFNFRTHGGLNIFKDLDVNIVFYRQNSGQFVDAIAPIWMAKLHNNFCHHSTGFSRIKDHLLYSESSKRCWIHFALISFAIKALWYRVYRFVCDILLHIFPPPKGVGQRVPWERSDRFFTRIYQNNHTMQHVKVMLYYSDETLFVIWICVTHTIHFKLRI